MRVWSGVRGLGGGVELGVGGGGVRKPICTDTDRPVAMVETIVSV